MKKSSKVNKKSGFTLIELVVSMAVAAIAISILTGLFTLTLHSYRQSTSLSEAQAFSSLVLRKVENELKTASTLQITSSKITTPAYKELYFDSSQNCLIINKAGIENKYYAGMFDNYDFTLTFTPVADSSSSSISSSSSSEISHLLQINETVKNKSGTKIYTLSTTVYLDGLALNKQSILGISSSSGSSGIVNNYISYKNSVIYSGGSSSP